MRDRSLWKVQHFVLFALCFASLITVASLPVLRPADSAPIPAKQREPAIDGLRGVLAYAVFLHHAVIYRTYLSTGRWIEPSTRFYAYLGPFAVCVFFMITGYLFFSQLLASGGRADWFKFYVNRVFRIGPLYTLAVTGMLILVFTSQHFRLVQPFTRVVAESVSWLALGIGPWMPVNGDYFPDQWLAGVTWTIHYEWYFYFSLIALALLARRPRAAHVVILATLAFLLIRPAARNAIGIEAPGSILLCLFLVGMLCALQKRSRRAGLPEPWRSILSVALASLAFVARAPYTWLPVIALGCMFMLVCDGCSIFGVLTLRPMLRMGNVSYGIYLLQGFALALAFQPEAFRDWASHSVFAFPVLTVASAIVLLVISTVAHVTVERPGIAVGRLLVRRIYTAKPQWSGGR